MAKEFRSFFFTDLIAEKSFYDELFETQKINYMVISEEICQETNKKTYRGYVHFKNGRTLQSMTRIFNPRTLETCTEIPRKNCEYFTKDKTLFEWGEKSWKEKDPNKKRIRKKKIPTEKEIKEKEEKRITRENGRMETAFQKARKQCSEKGSEMMTSRDDYYKLYTEADKRKSRVPVDWKCSICGKISNSNPDHEDFSGKCKSCSGKIGHAKVIGEILTYELFCEDVERFNKEMISPKSEYVRSTTKMWIRDKTTERMHYISFTKWRKGTKRSRQDVDDDKCCPIEKVAEKCEKRDLYIIDSTGYRDKTSKIKVGCKRCQRTSILLVGNIGRDFDGCSKCRMVVWSKIQKLFDEEGCTLISQSINYVNRNTPLEYFCSCGGEGFTTWKNFQRGTRCNNCTIQRRRETNLERYGNVNFLASEEGKGKIKEWWEREGVNHHMELQKYKDAVAETTFKNFGVKCILATEEVRNMALLAHIEKWGAPPGFVEEIRVKMQETIERKYGDKCIFNTEYYKQLMLERYNSETFAQTDEFKRIMVERFGVEHATQNPDLMEKAIKSMFKTKIYKFPSGREDHVQGYEPYCLTHLLTMYDEDDIVTGVKNMPDFRYHYDESERRYYPDIYIPKENKIIEVKSTYTKTLDEDKNWAKWISVARAGYNMEIYVYRNKGKLDHHIKTFPKRSIIKTIDKNGNVSSEIKKHLK